MNDPHPLTQSKAWTTLSDERRKLSTMHLRDVFAHDEDRAKKFSRTLGPLHLDFSKQHINEVVIESLLDLAKAQQVAAQRDAMMAGEAVNNTENRAVLHMALRGDEDSFFADGGRPVMKQVLETRKRFLTLAEDIRSGAHQGTGGAIRSVVHIGIGGSDFGPRMVVDALKATPIDGPEVRFLSNVDGAAFDRVVDGLDPKTTLVIVVSKSFTTLETKLNMQAAQAWLKAGGGDIAQQMVAVTANVPAATEAGFAEQRLFPMWDWVGGRFSLWSAVGLPIAIACGADVFEQLLAGARAMDQHFKEAPLEDNWPVLLGALDVWQSNFWLAGTRTILPYDHRLKLLAPFLQQLEMESNGKRVRRDGVVVDLHTAPVIWGGECTDGQHAYFQLLHQSERLIPTEFIAAVHAGHDHRDQHRALLANCIAQSEALMRGKTAKEVREELLAAGMEAEAADQLVPHKTFPGNKPSTTILMERLDAFNLGMLLALYEHRVFVAGALWDINSFDQWGVELGKVLAKQVDADLAGTSSGAHDNSTNALIAYVRDKTAS